jgi:hypothetical protein
MDTHLLHQWNDLHHTSTGTFIPEPSPSGPVTWGLAPPPEDTGCPSVELLAEMDRLSSLLNTPSFQFNFGGR